MNVTIQLTEEDLAKLKEQTLEALPLSLQFVQAVAAHLERPLRWLDIRQVSERTRKGVSTIRRDWRIGAFPSPCAYEGGKALWRESDVERFMLDREREASGQQAEAVLSDGP